MKKIKSLFIVLVIIGMTSSLLIGVNTVNAQRPTVKVGVLVPDKITPGADAIKGVELAVEQINVDGIDIGGTIHNIQLFKETTSGEDGLPNAATGSASLAKLQDDENVLAIIGGFRTEVVSQLQGELTQTPFLGVGSTAPITSDYFFRVGPTNGSRLAYGVAELYGVVMNALGVRNVTVVREDATWTVSLSGGIKAIIAGAYAKTGYINNFTFSDDLVISESATASAVESALSGVDDGIDALLTLFSGPVGGSVTAAWAKLEMDQYLAGINVESQASNFFKDSDGAAYGEIELETAPPDVDLTSKSAPFKTAFDDKYSELPTYTSYAAYDATYVLVEALKASGTTSDGVALQAALVNTNYLGAAGRYKFTSEPGQTTASNTTTVHDLWTPLTYGVHAGEYIGGRFAQWQQNGTKVTVWGHKSFSSDVADLQLGLPKMLKAPIDHSDFGTIPTEAAPIPGYEMPFVLLVLGSLAVLVRLPKRKN
ncbi:MAG: ABC transporter substrate-binding protein [Candidatus Hodarchaeales archaeon]|jgi:ABC-type branched-subunit amino acid transport system substrate-binding protein